VSSKLIGNPRIQNHFPFIHFSFVICHSFTIGRSATTTTMFFVGEMQDGNENWK